MSTGQIIIDHGCHLDWNDETIDAAHVNPKLCELLETLLATGPYGHNAADVAVRLIEHGVRAAIEQGVIVRKSKPVRVG